MALAEDVEIGRSEKESSLGESTATMRKAVPWAFAYSLQCAHVTCNGAFHMQYLRRPASICPSSVMSSASLCAILMANSLSLLSCSTMAALWTCSSRSRANWISSSACKHTCTHTHTLNVTKKKCSCQNTDSARQPITVRPLLCAQAWLDHFIQRASLLIKL